MSYLDSIGLSHLLSKLKALLSSKQNKLTGNEDQIVGFNATGDAIAKAGVKSVYEFAKSGGYEGTEEDLAVCLSDGPWIKAWQPFVFFEDNKDFGISIGSGDNVILFQNGIYYFYNNGLTAKISVGTPTANSHAATKKYVDDKIAAEIAKLSS